MGKGASAARSGVGACPQARHRLEEPRPAPSGGSGTPRSNSIAALARRLPARLRRGEGQGRVVLGSCVGGVLGALAVIVGGGIGGWGAGRGDVRSAAPPLL